MGRLPFEDLKRDVLIKKESQAEFGKYPNERSTEEIIQFGVVNIDKPQGPTSHQVSDYVQRILNISKAGHSGTLDPNVSGVLPIALGRATRIVQTLLPAGKEYIALMHMHKKVEIARLERTLEAFMGKIRQVPPLKSAVKRVERTRSVYYINIMEIEEQDVLFRVGCQAGTYIRKLCHDVGQKLGVGAHMQELRRTKAGPFDESSLHTLQDLTDAFYYFKEGNEKFLRKVIQPVENAIAYLPKVWADDNAIGSLSHGIDLKVPGIPKLNPFEKSETVAVMTMKDELIALGTAMMSSEDIMKNEKGIAVNVHKVFITL